MTSGGPAHLIRTEWFFGISVATCLVFMSQDSFLMGRLSDPVWLGVIFLWLFATVMGSALSVVRHADHLAVRLGEPYGTLILTLSVTSIEVMGVSAAMLHGRDDPTLVRATLFSVVMIILNGMVGLSLLVGGWRHREQNYNFQGANTYLGLIIPLAVLSLIMPNFTQTTAGPTLSIVQESFLILMSVGLYGAFLMVQVGRHRGYFTIDGDDVHPAPNGAGPPPRPLMLHAVLLALYMIPVVFLVELLARPVDYLIDTLDAPVALGGMIMALLVAAPEAVGAVRAASHNHLQRAVNIFLGSVLSTIGLTVPAMLVIARLTGHGLVLGLQHTDFVMLLLTLAVSTVTFASGRTNMLQGAVHLLLFAAYLLLIFQS